VFWAHPLDGHRITDRKDARSALDDYAATLRRLSGFVGPDNAEALGKMQRSLVKLLVDPSLAGEGPLDRQDIETLNIARALTEPVVEAALDDIRGELGSLPEMPQVKVDKEEVRRQLNKAFNKGQANRLEQLKRLLTAADELTHRTTEIGNWAERARDLISGPAKAGTDLRRAVDFLERADKVVKTSKDMAGVAASIAEFDGQGSHPGELEGEIARFRGGLNLIDSAVNYLPGLGQLWRLQRPLADAALQRIQDTIAPLRDQQRRELADLDDPDHIPPELVKAFPGGQPVFDYMRGLRSGGTPDMNAKVEKFFVDNARLLNAGQRVGERLEVRRSGKSNAEEFVAYNREIVWAQLYGTYEPSNSRKD